MKKLSVLLMVLALAGCSNTPASTTKTGSAEVGADDSKTTVTVTLEGDKLTAVEIDQVNGDSTKKQLGNDYNMKQASGIEKEWFEQAEFLENYMVENNTTEIELDETGKAVSEDVLSGCTIGIKDIVDAASQAVKAAK